MIKANRFRNYNWVDAYTQSTHVSFFMRHHVQGRDSREMGKLLLTVERDQRSLTSAENNAAISKNGISRSLY